MIPATPPWLLDQPWQALTPPAEVLVLGELPRAPEKYLRATRALHVTTSRRYQPDVSGTKCNVFLSDGCQLLNAPLPHVFDIGDGQGKRELRANDIIDGLRALAFPGWSKLGTVASEAAIIANANAGVPTIATWRNWQPSRTAQGAIVTLNGRTVYRPGHVVFVVPTPAGQHGIFVTGAGASCLQECPIAMAFGKYLPDVEFWSHS
jgi:hypothetical protein